MLLDLIQNGSKAVFDYYTEDHKHKFKRVFLEENDISVIKQRAKIIISKKLGESHNLKDSGSMIKRWVTGWSGERVVEKYLGLEFIDLSIGESYEYNQPDLLKAGYLIGVKSCHFGDFPLLKTPSASHVSNPQIFIAKESANSFLVLGLGHTDVVNDPKNYTSLLVRSNAVYSKRAFYRFDLLQHDFNLEDLLPYKLL